MYCLVRLPAIVLQSVLLVSIVCYADVLRVPEEYATLTDALNQVTALDTVLISPGVFEGAEYYGEPDSPVGVTIMGSGWPCGTIVVGCDEQNCSLHSVLVLHNVVGWRITNLEFQWAEYGIRTIDCEGIEIDNNFIHDITGGVWGCAIHPFGNVIETDIHHNLIANCHAGLFVGWEGQPGVTENLRIYNNTMVDIWGSRLDVGLAAMQIRAQTPTGSAVVNNLILKSKGPGVEFAICEQADTEVSYNCVLETAGAWQNMVPGEGNIEVDPQFTHRGGFPDYFFLDVVSPCIDAGHPGYPPDPDGTVADIGAFPVQQVGSSNRQPVPAQFGLKQNYPNPFNQSTQISFAPPRGGHAELSVYSVRGELVERLLDGPVSAGEQTVTFDAGDFASGVYFYRLKSEGLSLTRKMVLLK